ncbi:MAG: nickel-dependent lactate racemase [Victivallales bacterium]|jgi:nickel-dependent lactate racemase|nr:nickel-dependent lactate racemase [Victivallales bacterium]
MEYMTTINLPYNRTEISGEIAEENFLGSFESALPEAATDQAAAVDCALDSPIKSPKLEELARGKRSAVIIASDHTRPVPSKFIVPQLLSRLRQNSPDIDITILIATGFHRGTTKAELVAKFGTEIVEREKIVIHDSNDASSLIRLGTLPSGGELIVNRLAIETELLLSEGFIEPHFFAGFSGGRKSVLPGIASRQTVLANHCSEFIQSPYARTGNLADNPIHRDMVFAAKATKLAFIANVVIDRNKKIVRAFAGDPFEAHRAGCDFLRSFAEIKVPLSDIVVTSNGGYPLDQNVYQTVKGMTAGEAATRENGVIIIAASCSDGHGGESFYQNLANAASPEELLRRVANIPRDQTEPDQWEFQILGRILAKRKVIVVTRDCDHAMLKKMHLLTASTLNEALNTAFAITGKNSKVAVIPDGVSVIIKGYA